MNRKKRIILAGAAAAGIGIALLSACRVSIPQNAVAVRPFDLQKYLGTWYEIARLDFKYEKGLSKVTATYSLRPDGMIKVDNRGYDANAGKWKESVGKAKPVGEPSEGRLKVSFFGPFYAGYNVIAIDPGYRYALVAGNNLDYLWILSRERVIPENVKDDYLSRAKALGYAVNELVWTAQ